MKLDLACLIDHGLLAYAPEAREFRLRRSANRGPRDWNELKTARISANSIPVAVPPPEEIVIKPSGVPLRVFVPTSTPACAVLLDIHGGGFYMGSARGNDVRNRGLAERLGIAVVSIDYRLAPENPWPAAPDDCETAAMWIVAHGESVFGTDQFVIGGVSAGATLAMTTLLRLRDRDVHAFAGAVLQYGTYDLSGLTPAGRLIEGEYFLEAYVGAVEDRRNPDISPIYAELSGLPRTLIVVGASDLLLADNLAMATRLCLADVDVDLRIYPESQHGFTLHPTAMARRAISDVDAWLAECIARTSV